MSATYYTVYRTQQLVDPVSLWSSLLFSVGGNKSAGNVVQLSLRWCSSHDLTSFVRLCFKIFAYRSDLLLSVHLAASNLLSSTYDAAQKGSVVRRKAQTHA